MKLLAFDTSTEVMSIAVSRDDQGETKVWQHSGVGGAQASTHLITQVLDLLAQADMKLAELDAIAFGSGPGSFTGLRTACAVAQGLAFGANVPVLMVDSLLAVAEEARFSAFPDQTPMRVAALLDARMDELYSAWYEFDSDQWRCLLGHSLIRPEDWRAPDGSMPLALAGNVFSVYGARLAADAGLPRIPALPTASAMLRLAPQMLARGEAVPAAQALPSYVRDKVAKTTAERDVEKAAKAAALLAAGI